jgi:hypothetical protein
MSNDDSKVVLAFIFTAGLYFAVGYVVGYNSHSKLTAQLLDEELARGKKIGQEEGIVAASSPTDS